MERPELPTDAEIRNIGVTFVRAERGEIPESGSGTETLCRLIEEAAGSAAMYELLALKMRGTPHERVLRRMAREERELESKMQADHLIITGDTHPIPVSYPSAPYLLRALADQARRELARSRLPLPPLKELPALSLRHAEELREMIAKTIANR